MGTQWNDLVVPLVGIASPSTSSPSLARPGVEAEDSPRPRIDLDSIRLHLYLTDASLPTKDELYNPGVDLQSKLDYMTRKAKIYPSYQDRLVSGLARYLSYWEASKYCGNIATEEEDDEVNTLTWSGIAEKFEGEYATDIKKVAAPLMSRVVGGTWGYGEGACTMKSLESMVSSFYVADLDKGNDGDERKYRLSFGRCVLEGGIREEKSSFILGESELTIKPEMIRRELENTRKTLWSGFPKFSSEFGSCSGSCSVLENEHLQIEKL